MRLISEFLFGRRITIEDEKVGQLKARVRGHDPSINCTWTSKHQLTGQARPTLFILEGNCEGPYKEQLVSVYNIINTLNEIKAKVDRELKIRNDIKDRFRRDWTKEFSLSAIIAYDPYSKGTNKQFEVCFESINEEDTDYISLIWVDGRLDKIEV